MSTLRHWSMLAGVMLALASGCGGGGGGSPTEPPPPPGGNHNPTVNLNVDKSVVSYGETAALSAATADVDGDQVTLSWSSGRGSVQSSGPTATTATYTAPSSWGIDSVVATASDGNGGSGRGAARVYVRNPLTPVFTIGATGSASCGYGTPIPNGFILTITPAENVLITNISIEPRQCNGPAGRTSTIRSSSRPARHSPGPPAAARIRLAAKATTAATAHGVMEHRLPYEESGISARSRGWPWIRRA